ncbi:uncharacterized protein KY384_000807 [Bacidia gigantensis]|uniref:uncharacterized protein n=1 Tax=Bacidia gigantensis TaxID=2732470 RepID=UPI001D03EDF4|nr:uncharacterized protein KY384_000807 [Bacidia gigantensis]KAG8526045.1 hypothetical protein KY384_000807 [Bacidia gigantensis]
MTWPWRLWALLVPFIPITAALPTVLKPLSFSNDTLHRQAHDHCGLSTSAYRFTVYLLDQAGFDAAGYYADDTSSFCISLYDSRAEHVLTCAGLLQFAAPWTRFWCTLTVEPYRVQISFYFPMHNDRRIIFMDATGIYRNRQVAVQGYKIRGASQISALATEKRDDAMIAPRSNELEIHCLTPPGAYEFTALFLFEAGFWMSGYYTDSSGDLCVDIYALDSAYLETCEGSLIFQDPWEPMVCLLYRDVYHLQLDFRFPNHLDQHDIDVDVTGSYLGRQVEFLDYPIRNDGISKTVVEKRDSDADSASTHLAARGNCNPSFGDYIIEKTPVPVAQISVSGYYDDTLSLICLDVFNPGEHLLASRSGPLTFRPPFTPFAIEVTTSRPSYYRLYLAVYFPSAVDKTPIWMSVSGSIDDEPVTDYGVVLRKQSEVAATQVERRDDAAPVAAPIGVPGALTHNELTWSETLLPSQFSELAGPIPGHDLVGIVKATFAAAGEVDGGAGKLGTKFKVGDKVVGLLAFNRGGAAAEEVVAQEGEMAGVPVGLVGDLDAEGKEGGEGKGWDMLATVPLSGLSAWQALFEHAGVDAVFDGLEKGKKKVLVTGASGSVGVLVVQMAKAAGCWVVGSSSGRNEEFVRGLGADEVVDYTKCKHLEDGFEKKGLGVVDVVVDTVGKETLVQALSEKVLRKGGRAVSLAMGLEDCGPNGEKAALEVKEREIEFKFFIVRPDGGQLAKIMDLVAAKKVRGVVAGVYDLEKGKEAMEVVESGRVRGKIVLKVADMNAT